MSNNSKTLDDFGDFINPAEIDEILNLLPEPEIIWRGIPRGTIGLIFGQSKTGKSTLAENLGYNIAAKRAEFLGEELRTNENEKIVIANIEEPSRNRLRRHKSILSTFSDEEIQNINSRIIINGEFHGFFNSQHLWNTFAEKVIKLEPTILVIDSLTRLIEGDSKEDKSILKIMKNLSELNKKLNATIIVIHHTTKMYGKDIDQDSIAGNHVLQQEIDFAIGLQKNGRTVFIKDIINRYCVTDDRHIEVKIKSNQTFTVMGNKTAEEIVKEMDARRDDTNRKAILKAVEEISEKSTDDFATRDEILTKINIPQRTYYDNLKKLLKDGKLIEVEKTKYKLS